jgi:hypothetical protein
VEQSHTSIELQKTIFPIASVSPSKVTCASQSQRRVRRGKEGGKIGDMWREKERKREYDVAVDPLLEEPVAFEDFELNVEECIQFRF